MTGPTVAFVMEQALGHITHTKNLQGAMRDNSDLTPLWSLIEFRASGWARRMPIYRSNWTVRAGLRARRRLAALSRQHRLDAVYFHTQVPAIFAQRWVKGLPSVVSIDATPQQCDEFGGAYGHTRGPDWLEHLKWRLNRRNFAAATRIVALSHWAKQGLVEGYDVPAAKISVVGPGIDPGRWRPVDRRGRSERTPLKVLFVGGDFVRKGGPLLLDAFAALSDLGFELHLVTRQEVPDAPAGCFVHAGLQPNSPELVQLFEEADVFCLPTDADAIPMVFCEAGAAGLPCIATEVGAVPEIVRDGETGILIPTGDRTALVRALRTLLTDEDLRLRYGQAAREHVLRNYDSRTNAARVVAVCQEVIAAA